MTAKRTTKALSVRAPWWWFILKLGKDIENRDWPTSFRGTVYLHVGKWWGKAQIAKDGDRALTCYSASSFRSDSAITWTELRSAGGCIVGTIDIVDCVNKSDSPWFFGKFGFVLANPVVFDRPIPCNGALGFFTLPDDVLAEIEAGTLAVRVGDEGVKG